MDNRIVIKESGSVRAILDGEVKRLEILAVPFGSPSRKDKLGEWLSKKTRTLLELGRTIPTLYAHGKSPHGRKMSPIPVLGMATVSKLDDSGWWVETQLDESELSARTWKAALEGTAKASTGAFESIVSPTGEVLSWPVYEVSVFDTDGRFTPVSDDAIVLPIRSIYRDLDLELPAEFEAGEDKSSQKPNNNNTRGVKMNEKELKAWYEAQKAAEQAEKDAKDAEKVELRKSIIDELKADPKSRALFAIVKEDESEGKDAAKQEVYAYMRHLVAAARGEASPLLPQRGMEESEAAELGSLVPADLAAGISESRGKYSLVRRTGMTPYVTGSLTFTVPTQSADMTKLADIAEEGAYQENAPATVAKTVTLVKRGSLITVSEEALEDIPVLAQWLAREAGRALALAENEALYTLLASIDGVETAGTHAITDAEVMSCYFGLAQEERDGGIFIMNDATLAYLRAMLIATPRAYGELGFAPFSMGDVPGERFLNKPVFTNSNWTSIATAGDDVKIVDFVNLDSTIAWADHSRGFQIFVDPYTQRAAAGQVQFMPSARFAGVVLRTTALRGIDDHS